MPRPLPKPMPKPGLGFWFRKLETGPGPWPRRGGGFTLKVRPEHSQRLGQGVAPKLGLKL